MRLFVTAIILLALVAGCSKNSDSRPATQHPGGSQRLPKEIEGDPASALPKQKGAKTPHRFGG
jgi:hypothetical protein